jgi:hypothetical protein
MKLRKWVKVVLTMLLLTLSLIIYMKLDYWGFLARSSNFYVLVSIIGWFWLIVGQMVIYARIWR